MMKTKIYISILSIFGSHLFSQVGINMPNPSATLDINGNAKLRQRPQANSLNGYSILAVNESTSEISTIDVSLIGSNIVNTSVFAARKTKGISLLSLGLFPAGFRIVNFTNADKTVGSSSLFSDTENSYTVPSSGIYAIGFSFRYGTGIQSTLLANTPGIGILRTRSGTATLIDNRTFSGINSPLLHLTISETSINSVYSFLAGDKLSFGLTGSSLLTAGLLGSSIATVYIYKISN